MKTTTYMWGLAVAAVLVLTGCVKEDLDLLQKGQAEQEERIAALEAWQTTVNENIGTLQELVAALHNMDHVVSVSAFEAPAPGGYEIYFSKSGKATIWNGEEGVAPVIGVAEWPAGSGTYYWTIDGEFIVTDGKKMPVTGPKGDAGKTPELRVNDTTGYWEVSYDEGQNWISLDVKATGETGAVGPWGPTGPPGPPGDAIFARDGVDASNENYVVFTLVDGTKITLPKFAQDMIAFDSYELFIASASEPLVLRFAPNFKQSDYTALSASVKFDNGTAWDMQTRAPAASDRWQVSVTKPTFTDGVLDEDSATVTITATEEVWLAETALLTVTLTDKNGKDHSISRPVKYFDGLIVRNPSPGALRPILEEAEGDGQFTSMNLGVIGAIDDKDAEAISDFFSKYEGYLDLSMSDKEEIAFYGMMSRIILPPNATRIRDWAFSPHGLESVENCGNIEYVGEYAFWDDFALKHIELPKVKEIGNNAFGGCKNLRTISLGNELYYLGEWCFTGSGLVTITLPESLSEILEHTFYECRQLESIVLHDEMVTIGASAFEECTSLKKIRIPKYVRYILPRTFYNCTSLETLEIADKSADPRSSLSIRDEAFANCTSLLQTADTPGVLHFKEKEYVDGIYAFRGCTSLKKVILDGVADIPSYAFCECTNLEKVCLPEWLNRIGGGAFADTGLKTISLPPYLTYIGEDAFIGCPDLLTIYSYMETPPNVDSYNPLFDMEYKDVRKIFIPFSIATLARYQSWDEYIGNIEGDVPGPFEENR